MGRPDARIARFPMADLLSIFNLVAPFFGLILLGFAIGRYKQLPEEGLAWLQFFLIYVALPPLFYRLIADRKLSEARTTGDLFDEIKITHAKAHEKLLKRAARDERAGEDDEE